MNICQGFSRYRALHLCLGLTFAATFACSPASFLQLSRQATPPPIATEMIIANSTSTTAPDQDASGGLRAGWTLFEDDAYGLTFEYPSDWFGPEVNQFDGGVGVEVGSDTVYPFGTGRDERVYTITDAYFISVSYKQNSAGWDWEAFFRNSPWMETYTDLLELEDGEAITTPRNLTTRVGEVSVGQFSGLEYTSTLSETAQTEIFYAREVLLFDGDLNNIRITGSPNNVQIGSDEDWRAAYQRVDAGYYDIFSQLVESIAIGDRDGG